MRTLSPKIHSEISALVEAASQTGMLVRIYAEAEKIRRANIAENIALEDIANELIRRSADGPGYEADPSEAQDAFLGNGAIRMTIVH